MSRANSTLHQHGAHAAVQIGQLATGPAGPPMGRAISFSDRAPDTLCTSQNSTADLQGSEPYHSGDRAASSIRHTHVCKDGLLYMLICHVPQACRGLDEDSCWCSISQFAQDEMWHMSGQCLILCRAASLCHSAPYAQSGPEQQQSREHSCSGCSLAPQAPMPVTPLQCLLHSPKI